MNVVTLQHNQFNMNCFSYIFDFYFYDFLPNGKPFNNNSSCSMFILNDYQKKNVKKKDIFAYMLFAM